MSDFNPSSSTHGNSAVPAQSPNAPKRLLQGATIGLVAPAGPTPSDVIDKGIDTLRELGFRVKEGRHIRDSWGYLAGRDEDRAADLMEMFRDPDVDAILCVRGGYGCMRILPYINLDIIRSNPKIFVGYSDVTTLLNLFRQSCDFITFHGPMLNSDWSDRDTVQSWLDTLMDGFRPYTLANPDGYPTECAVPGVALGRLVGGNLELIVNSLGTPNEIDCQDAILFLEEVGERPYAIDRALTQLTLAGKLGQCRGFVLGQFTDCQTADAAKSLSLKEVWADRIASLGKPTVYGFMSGHESPKLTLPIGVRVRLDASTGTLDILERVVQ